MSEETKSPEDALRAIRSERDRFVAFAFSAADMLLELSPDRVIIFAAGATRALTGMASDDLLGKSILDLIAERDKDLIAKALDRCAGGNPLDETHLDIKASDGSTTKAILNGYTLSRLNKHFFLAVRPNRRKKGVGEAAVATHSIPGPADQLMMDSKSFAEKIGEQLLSGGDNTTLTFIELGDVGDLRDRLDDRSWAKLQTMISTLLQDASVDGDSAGKFSDERYGIVHKKDQDLSGLKKQIVSATKQIDPQGRGVEVKAASMGLDPTEVQDEDSARALIYTIKEFADNAESELTVENLTSNLTGRVKEATRQIAQVKAAIAEKSFQIAYQPIVALADGHWHHHEALVRVKTDTLNMAPFEFIKFAEDTGVIIDFDMAMCGEVMAAVTSAMEDGPVISVAVNISGRSLGSSAFVDSLRSMLNTRPELKGNLLFEITESARIKDLDSANNFIQVLRHAGYPVCMDDFGAGEAAFEYLRALDVDYVKIDGSYVDFAQREEKGKPFLRAMARLCHDLGIDTIAERIEDQEMVDFLLSCGVEYGQGYYYGRPSPDASLRLPPKPEKKKKAEAVADDEFADWQKMTPDQIKRLSPQKLEELKQRRKAELAAQKKAEAEAAKGTERAWS